MISGSNSVEYTLTEEYSAVAAYTVEPRAGGIISGGMGDSTVVVEMTRFFWRYDPDNQNNSGFIGVGWFADVQNTPLYVAGITEEVLVEGFTNGTRSDLNDIFSAWQAFIQANPNDNYVFLFQNMVYAAGGVEGCFEGQ